MEVVIESPAPAVAPGVIMAPGVIVAPDDEEFIQDGTPEPKVVSIAFGMGTGQLPRGTLMAYRGKSVLLTYPNLDSKPAVAAVQLSSPSIATG